MKTIIFLLISSISFSASAAVNMGDLYKQLLKQMNKTRLLEKSYLRTYVETTEEQIVASERKALKLTSNNSQLLFITRRTGARIYLKPNQKSMEIFVSIRYSVGAREVIKDAIEKELDDLALTYRELSKVELIDNNVAFNQALRGLDNKPRLLMRITLHESHLEQMDISEFEKIIAMTSYL